MCTRLLTSGCRRSAEQKDEYPGAEETQAAGSQRSAAPALSEPHGEGIQRQRDQRQHDREATERLDDLLGGLQLMGAGRIG